MEIKVVLLYVRRNEATLSRRILSRVDERVQSTLESLFKDMRSVFKNFVGLWKVLNILGSVCLHFLGEWPRLPKVRVYPHFRGNGLFLMVLNIKVIFEEIVKRNVRITVRESTRLLAFETMGDLRVENFIALNATFRVQSRPVF